MGTNWQLIQKSNSRERVQVCGTLSNFDPSWRQRECPTSKANENSISKSQITEQEFVTDILNLEVCNDCMKMSLSSNPDHSESVWKWWERVRTSQPLIHCITNFVSMDLMANTLLSIGAAPAMVNHSVNQMTCLADSCREWSGWVSGQWTCSAVGKCRHFGPCLASGYDHSC